MSAITTVVFDMFSTLAQDGPVDWERTFAAIVRGQGLATTPDALRGAWDAGAAAFRKQRNAPDAPFISYLDGWTVAFDRAFRDLGIAGDGRAAAQQSLDDLAARELFPETTEALTLVGQRRRVAVLSNADDCCLDPVAARIGVKFATVLSSEAGRRYKPDARLFQAVCQRMGVAPAECVYVGDKQFEDVQGARNAGMASVWINRVAVPANPALPAPDAEIRSLLDLPAALDGLELRG